MQKTSQRKSSPGTDFGFLGWLAGPTWLRCLAFATASCMALERGWSQEWSIIWLSREIRWNLLSAPMVLLHSVSLPLSETTSCRTSLTLLDCRLLLPMPLPLPEEWVGDEEDQSRFLSSSLPGRHCCWWGVEREGKLANAWEEAGGLDSTWFKQCPNPTLN